MPLIMCRCCGNAVNTRAFACARCGTPPISTKRRHIVRDVLSALFLALIAAIFLFFAYGPRRGGAHAPLPTTQAAHEDDATLIRRSTAEISQSEMQLVAANDKLLALVNGAVTQGFETQIPKEFVEVTGQLFLEMNAAVDRSQAIQMPQIRQTEARIHFGRVLAAHKRWALAQQARLGALSLDNRPLAEAFAAKAAAAAEEVILELAEVHRAAGVAAY
jgi:hypothetical protein